MFQGSETTGCDVIIYPQANDPLYANSSKVIRFDGRRNTSGGAGMVQSVDTSAAISDPSGNGGVVVKFPGPQDLRDLICDDDWIDIVMMRHGKKWTVLRGLVDDVRRATDASGGTTTNTWLISCRGFGKIFDVTALWYNNFAGENGRAVGIQLFQAENVSKSVDLTVENLLFGFLDDLSNKGRSSWYPPATVPNTANGFTGSVLRDYSGLTNDPVRFAVGNGFLDPGGGGAWQMAKTWSDPQFCELYVDLFSKQTQSVPPDAREMAPDDTMMGVVLRDIPFPTLKLGTSSPYFSLPMTVLQPQWVSVNETGRSGYERFNCFLVGPQVNQQFGIADNQQFNAPLWDLDSINIHGLRRYDINTLYCAKDSDILALTNGQREAVRDWYCMNYFFLTGTLSLARGFPEIHVGQRVRIKGTTDDEDQTFYVEGVSHSWNANGGMRTSLTVTRGWIGTDNSYMEALKKMAARYSVPKQVIAQ